MQERRASTRRERFLSSCTQVGPEPRLDGEPIVECEGTLVIGARLQLESRFAPSRLRVAKGARLSIGDDARIGFGAILSALTEVSIGDRVRMGAYVSIVDAGAGDPDFDLDRSAARPIRIGNDVELGSRVTILEGARIGDGAVITAGSVVDSDIPAGAIATGVPARVVRSATAALVHEALHSTAASHPEKEALIAADERLTYAELWTRVHALAEALAERGVGTGDPVLVFTTSKAAFLTSLYACFARGAIAVPVPDAAARATLLELRDGSGARILLTDEAQLARFPPRLGPSEGLSVIDVEPVLRRPAKRSGLARTALASGLSPPSPALIMFTSGTTAKKKAVLLTHANLLQATENTNAFMKLDGQVREYVAIPLSHSFGLGRARAIFAVGGTLVLHEGLSSPAAMLQAIASGGCNALSAVPATLAMFDAKHEALLRRAGPNLRTIELGSAFLSASDKRRLLELFPNARICMHYGLTEASRSTFLEFRSEAAKLDTVGRPSPNVTIQICDPDGRALPPGEHGEIFVSGGHVTAGYWNDVERTRAHLTADRAFRTGDHGYFDADGYVCLLGRKDELINCGGVKISPLELEAKIAEARPTLEFCVVGIPDPAGIAGEVPVVAVAGAPQPTLTLAALTAELAQKVEKNKLPREVIFIDRIPRTENGKPIRRELRALLSNAAPAERSS